MCWFRHRSQGSPSPVLSSLGFLSQGPAPKSLVPRLGFRPDDWVSLVVLAAHAAVVWFPMTRAILRAEQ